MTQVVLIPAAQTDWRAQGRLAGGTDLPLNEYGHRQAVAYAAEIAALQPTTVRSGTEKATKQTATLLAHELRVKVRSSKELREVSLGLWEGLSQDELGERFARVYRQWRTAPLAVEPPEGEALAIAAERLRSAVEKVANRHPGETIVIVLGQFAYALLRCQLADCGYEAFWEYVDGEPATCAVNLNSPSAPTFVPPGLAIPPSSGE